AGHEPVRQPGGADRAGLPAPPAPRRDAVLRARARRTRRRGRDPRIRGVAAVTVARVAAAHYRVPREVWWPDGRIGASLYEIDHVELVTVEVETDEGVTGAGFTYTVGHGGSAVLALLEDEIAPALVGRDAHDAEPIWHELHARLHFVGSG